MKIFNLVDVFISTVWKKDKASTGTSEVEGEKY